MAVDLGSTTATGNVVWAIGVARDPVVQYTTSDGTTELRHPYYLSSSSFHSELDAVRKKSSHRMNRKSLKQPADGILLRRLRYWSAF